MKLSQILVGEPGCKVKGRVDRPIKALRYDSRQVQEHDVFFAWRGVNQDGHHFIAEVCGKGATAVVLEDPAFAGEGGTTFVEVQNARHALATMSAAYYGRPDLALRMIGVTGTNGKTTTTFLIKHLLSGAGQNVGLIGTVGYEIGRRILPATRTTPEASDLHELLAQMKAADCESVVMEVSSHALEQGRVLPIEYQVGVFTNLTQDHLDYHGTMENYFEAKKVLFKNLDREKNPGWAILNADDPYSERLEGAMSGKVKRLLYSVKPGRKADLAADALQYTAQGSRGNLRIGKNVYPFFLPLLGSFNVSNALAAAGAALALGLEPEKIVAGLASAPQVPGRLERFVSGDNITAVVDYAHTDDAVRKALSVLRGLTTGKLIVVLGCGGNRDQAKRPKMAQAAVETADEAVFTADNPRDESIDKILDQMEAGVRGKKNYRRQPDRRAAIAEALALAQPGDIVCVAGKGHEATQEIAGKYLPFDDRRVVEDFLKRRAS
jgi:UDP-N-acetylmuramoyl-L-alanyl-D-glutamate--2,6-diaminopimelate ligase